MICLFNWIASVLVLRRAFENRSKSLKPKVQTWVVKNRALVLLKEWAFSLQIAVDDFQMILALCFGTL